MQFWPEDVMKVCVLAREVAGHQKSTRVSTCEDGRIIQVLHACDAVGARQDGLHIVLVRLQDNMITSGDDVASPL